MNTEIFAAYAGSCLFTKTLNFHVVGGGGVSRGSGSGGDGEGDGGGGIAVIFQH